MLCFLSIHYGVGGYSHAPDDLSYGVDMKRIRWCGILQVYKTYVYCNCHTVTTDCHLGRP